MQSLIYFVLTEILCQAFLCEGALEKICSLISSTDQSSDVIRFGVEALNALTENGMSSSVWPLWRVLHHNSESALHSITYTPWSEESLNYCRSWESLQWTVCSKINPHLKGAVGKI